MTLIAHTQLVACNQRSPSSLIPDPKLPRVMKTGVNSSHLPRNKLVNLQLMCALQPLRSAPNKCMLSFTKEVLFQKGKSFAGNMKDVYPLHHSNLPVHMLFTAMARHTSHPAEVCLQLACMNMHGSRDGDELDVRNPAWHDGPDVEHETWHSGAEMVNQTWHNGRKMTIKHGTMDLRWRTKHGIVDVKWRIKHGTMDLT